MPKELTLGLYCQTRKMRHHGFGSRHNMKVFNKYRAKSRPLERISSAVIRYAPSTVEFTDTIDGADLVILYAWGRLHHLEMQIESLKKLKKKYVMLQIGVKTTRNRTAAEWMPLWRSADLVWSYLDLPGYCKVEGNTPDFNFYYSPLGLDDGFRKAPVRKKYIIASNGLGYTTESARECILAAHRVGRKAFHVGPIITNRRHVEFSNGMTDAELAKKYSQCEFVSGLRRGEGFELPVIEGLVCGARPILFDRPEAHQWFDGLGIFIRETKRASIINNIEKVFRRGPVPVTNAEITETRGRFNWKPIIEGFWERI